MEKVLLFGVFYHYQLVDSDFHLNCVVVRLFGVIVGLFGVVVGLFGVVIGL
ncbi:MAG TPA: hypothetical protein PKY82_11115 [Pyrinomonadaceae bacterium]|nr:hypothetical protein [Pyrinomonadaceae bacterium]